MFKIFVTQHEIAVTPFNNYYLENMDNGFKTFVIGAYPNFEGAENALKDLLRIKFDGHYDETSGGVLVNEEIVYRDGDIDCVFDGMHFSITPIWDDEPEEGWKKVLNALDSDITIIVAPDCSAISVDYLVLMNLDCMWLRDLVDDFIGRKVFWLDPCALRNEEHTSSWRTINDISDDVITFDDDTQVFIYECFI